jgi:uncharacterized protein YjbI with pentapeptide repeats
MKIHNETPLKPAWTVAAIDPPSLAATWIVKGTFRLVPSEPAKEVEEGESPTGDAPYPDGPEESLKYEADFAPFKPKTDVMLVGTCHPPGGKPTSVCRISFAVGRWEKAVAVIGDRDWKRGILGSSMSEPASFRTMPIRYDRAFGGPAYPRNPIGRGHLMSLLPNVEDPVNLISSASADVEPAGFGPIPRTWEVRNTRLGSFNGAWLKERWPWFPKNFGWSHFNAAPRDQQLEGYLRGDETLRFVNLHPVHSRYESRLPGLRPQLFVVDGDGAREAPLKLDTLWVDADEEKLILVWRGSLPTKSIKLADVREIHVVQTRLEAPPETWEGLRRKAGLREAQTKEAKEKEAAKANADAAAFEAVMARFEEHAAAALQASEKEVQKAVVMVSADLASSGLPPVAPIGTMALPPLPAFPMAEFLKESAGDPVVAPIMQKLPPLEEEAAKEDEGSEQTWTRERCLAHAAAGGSFAEQNLADLDLSGADLSGRDFQGAVLTGAVLTGARLSKCDFTRADLSHAALGGADLTESVLTRADLTAAQLAETCLDGAHLERTTLAGAVLAQASLCKVRADRADFAGADLTGAALREGMFFKADFSDATLARSDFSKASLVHAQVQGAKGPGAKFAGADLSSLHAGNAPQFPGASFKEVRADGSYWEGAILEKADFTRASLIRADFDSATLVEAQLEGADLRHSVLDDSKLDRAHLKSSNLFRASFQRASLRGADLRGANLYESDGWNAVLEGALMEGANLKMTKLAGAS